jgi:hypothetical protein
VVTPPTGRPDGRPPYSLRDDKDRYNIAYFAALKRTQAKRGASARFVALTLMQLRHMRVVEDEGNIRAMHEGRPFKIWAPGVKLCGDPKGSAEHPRNKSIFHAMADNFVRKERELEKLDGETDDGRWFIAMVKAWMLCLDGYGARSVAMAKHLTASVDETDYFKREMFPIFMRRCIFLLAPEFTPHD